MRITSVIVANAKYIMYRVLKCWVLSMETILSYVIKITLYGRLTHKWLQTCFFFIFDSVFKVNDKIFDTYLICVKTGFFDILTHFDRDEATIKARNVFDHTVRHTIVVCYFSFLFLNCRCQMNSLFKMGRKKIDLCKICSFKMNKNQFNAKFMGILFSSSTYFCFSFLFLFYFVMWRHYFIHNVQQ